MVTIEEFADGILQITSTGNWDAAAWESAHKAIEQYDADGKPIYVLINLSGILNVDEAAFLDLITAPQHADTGLSILVARKAHLRLARKLASAKPNRNEIHLRLMPQIDSALRVLLDRQVMDRINAANI